VTLREHGRKELVELRDGAASVAAPPVGDEGRHERRDRRESVESEASAPADPATEGRAADGVREVRRIFQTATTPPRWPMYIRQAKQFMRNVDPSFDERRFGFGSLVDLVRACQREGLFRIERDRQGVVRIFQGPALQPASAQQPVDYDNRGNIAEPVVVTEADEAPAGTWSQEAAPGGGAGSEVVEAAGIQEIDVVPVVDAEELPQQAVDAGTPTRGRRGSRGARGPRGEEARGPRQPQDAAAQRPRKTAAKPRPPRPPRTRKDVPQ
jgi:hypothetical protein